MPARVSSVHRHCFRSFFVVDVFCNLRVDASCFCLNLHDLDVQKVSLRSADGRCGRKHRVLQLTSSCGALHISSRPQIVEN